VPLPEMGAPLAAATVGVLIAWDPAEFWHASRSPKPEERQLGRKPPQRHFRRTG
jgi:hypothetical protein